MEYPIFTINQKNEISRLGREFFKLVQKIREFSLDTPDFNAVRKNIISAFDQDYEAFMANVAPLWYQIKLEKLTKGS